MVKTNNFDEIKIQISTMPIDQRSVLVLAVLNVETEHCIKKM
jgi:hypothetical protein